MYSVNCAVWPASVADHFVSRRGAGVWSHHVCFGYCWTAPLLTGMCGFSLSPAGSRLCCNGYMTRHALQPWSRVLRRASWGQEHHPRVNMASSCPPPPTSTVWRQSCGTVTSSLWSTIFLHCLAVNFSSECTPTHIHTHLMSTRVKPHTQYCVCSLVLLILFPFLRSKLNVDIVVPIPTTIKQNVQFYKTILGRGTVFISVTKLCRFFLKIKGIPSEWTHMSQMPSLTFTVWIWLIEDCVLELNFEGELFCGKIERPCFVADRSTIHAKFM